MAQNIKGKVAGTLYRLTHATQGRQKFPSHISATLGRITQTGQVHIEGVNIMTASAQIAGNTSANIAEVEANTKALRVTLRPEDVGSLGAYSLSSVTGLITAGMAANLTIFGFRWGDATRFALIKRVTISLGNDVTAFTAGSFSIAMYRALGFTGSFTTSGTDITPTGNQNKLRTTGFGTTLLTQAYILNTAVGGITGSTISALDTSPVGIITGGIPAVGGTNMSPPFALWDVRPGEYPLVLAQNEGFVIREIAVPVNGTWKLGIKVDWSEVTAY